MVNRVSVQSLKRCTIRIKDERQTTNKAYGSVRVAAINSTLALRSNIFAKRNIATSKYATS